MKKILVTQIKFFLSLIVWLLVAKAFHSTALQSTWVFIIVLFALLVLCVGLYFVDWDNVKSNIYFARIKRAHKREVKKETAEEIAAIKSTKTQ